MCPRRLDPANGTDLHRRTKARARSIYHANRPLLIPVHNGQNERSVSRLFLRIVFDTVCLSVYPWTNRTLILSP